MSAFLALGIAFGIRLPGNLTWHDPLQGTLFSRFQNIGTAMSALLPYLFVAGGFILLAMVVFGAFELMTSAGNEEKLKAGAERIKNALLGALLLFIVYWLAQIVQVLFKIQIL